MVIQKAKYSSTKIIVAGDKVHTYEYSQPYKYGFTQPKRNYNRVRPSKDNEDNLSNVYRTKKAVKLLLQSNAFKFSEEGGFQLKPLFVTLTFKDNVTDVKQANKDFKLFIQRLNYQLQTKTKYLVVPEFQKRGAVHYHAVFFNFPRTKNTNAVISPIWGKGFTFNEDIKNIQHLTAYVTKYFTKSITDERLKGKKHYFTSRQLERPYTIRDDSQGKNIIGILKNQIYTKTYHYKGVKTTYSVYENNPVTELLKPQKRYPQDPWLDKENYKYYTQTTLPI